MTTRLFYRSYNDYLREKFGEKVYKISLDAGFDCPNRDGTLAVGGCTYCDEGSRAPGVNPKLAIRDQLMSGMERMKKRYHAKKFIAYFQAFTNTYDRVEVLRDRYHQALDHPDIVGISVSTRPDCISEGALDLLEEISVNGSCRRRTISTVLARRLRAVEASPSAPPVKTEPFETWLEIGLQTIHDKTNERLNRWHTYKQFKDALVKARKKQNLKICTHIILGLPGESRDDMLATMDAISQLPIDGVKLHVLHVIRNTKLHEEYEQGQLKIFEENDYIKTLCDMIEKLPPQWIMHRVTGDAEPSKLIAPRWVLEKGKVLTKIDEEFKRRGTQQGVKYIPSRALSALSLDEPLLWAHDQKKL